MRLHTSKPKMLWLATAILAATLATSTPRHAFGYSYFTDSYGYPILWPDAESVRYLYPSSFPPDTTISTLMHEAMYLWVIVPGSQFNYYYAHLDEDAAPDHYDGYSDTYAVSASSLDPGVLGVTYMVNNTETGVWVDMDMEFSDFPAGSGWNFDANPSYDVITNDSDNGFSFLLVATHELGHALGLGHAPIGDEPAGSVWFIATMNPAYPAGGPLGKDNIVEVHTDERRAMRFLYPGPAETVTDLANSGYCSGGPIIGKAVPAFIEPSVVVPGNQPQAWSVIENFGTTSHSGVQQAFYLSEDDNVTDADLHMGTLVWDMDAGDAFEFGVGFDIGDLPAGQYYLGSILDDGNQIAEEFEDNNGMVYFEPLTILQAPPAFDSFSQKVVTCDTPFVGPTPQVDYPVNMAPITWTLDNPQPGMTIDPGTGVISWPQPIKSSFVYEIDVRATNSAGTATRTLRLGVQQAAPQIEYIPDQTTACGRPYTGPTPALTAPSCMASILEWRLLEGPESMTINSGSGVVQWPIALPSDAPYPVTMQAINATGHGNMSFLLTVGSANGDLDADGDVDLIDFAEFENCLTGPGISPSQYCICADFDADNDVDLEDFASIQTSYTGQVVHQGACCTSDGSCSDGSPLDCNANGGTYLGDGTECATSNCYGACCFYTGGCLDFPPASCTTAGGTFQGLATECIDLTCPASGQGACCLPDESCILASPSNCLAQAGLFSEAGRACETVDCSTPQGACCHTDGACTEGSPTDCIDAGATYMGDDTICSTVTCLGACCYPDGGCLDLSSPYCAITGGIYQGPGSRCDSTDCPVVPNGACCMPDESCEDTTEVICASSGGTYQGDDTTCAESDCTAAAQGACCLPNETCIDTTEAACMLASGTFTTTAISCSEMDCSVSATGACYDPTDWSCQETSEAICIATHRTFEGTDTSCSSTSAPEYLNEIDQANTYYNPGINVELADDMTLSGTARGLTYYNLDVYGGNNGGGSFGVTVSLYDGSPCDGGTIINGTTSTWSDVPDDDYIYVLEAHFDEPIRLPNTVWMVATFSTDQAGWVVTEQAEVGSTENVYGVNDPPWVCDYYLGGSPGPHAGFWAAIQCVEIPEATGACCFANETCSEPTESQCTDQSGMYQGHDTTCSTITCPDFDLGACCDTVDWSCTLTDEAGCLAVDGSFDGPMTSCTSSSCPEYRNDIDPASQVWYPAAPMGDDITLDGTGRILLYYEVAVYGEPGGGTFDFGAAFYTDSPCNGGTQLTETYAYATGLPEGQMLVLHVVLPTPVTLPDNPWLIMEFSTAYAGWILADQAETGYTADRFGSAVYNSSTGNWDWDCNLQVGDPPSQPYAGFWTKVQCANSIPARWRDSSDASTTPTITITPVDLPTPPTRLNTNPTPQESRIYMPDD